MSKRELVMVASIMVALVYSGATMVETMQLHSVGKSLAHDPAPLRPQFGTREPDCGHLYNVGRHREWAECMGVGYK